MTLNIPYWRMAGSPGSFLAKVNNDILAWDDVRDQKNTA
jgi:hypothetical protein